MGYRSDVGLALDRSAVMSLHQKLNALDKNSEAFSVIRDFISDASKHYEDSDTGAEVYFWEYVKWYDDFSEVDFIEKLMLDLADESYLFIRIGEDIDDLEIRGSFYGNPFELGLIRSITLEAPSV